METLFPQDIRVMIVEDERIVSHHLKMTLESFGYKVVANVPSGLEAVAVAEETRPNIILMDVFLKGKMDGIEAANYIRKKRDIPVIFITASAHDVILERIRASKPYGYLSKPFEDRELKTNIDMAMFRWRLENEMKKERALAKRYLDMAAVMMVALDKNGNIEMINQLGASLLGYHRKELVGKNWFDICIPTSEKSFVKLNFDDVITGQKEPTKHFENNVLTRFGVERIISWNSAVLKDEHGNITGILSAGEDITEKHIALKKLIKSEGLLKRAQKLAKIFTWEIDVLNAVLYPDISTESLFQNESTPLFPTEGIDLEDFIKLIHPEDKEFVEKTYANAIRTQKPYTITYRLITKSGVEKIIDDHIFKIKIENGLTTRIQGISQDVTFRRKIESALVQNDSLLLVINKLLSLNLHDTPLNKLTEQCLKIIVDVPLLKLLPKATLFLKDNETNKLVLSGSYGDVSNFKNDIKLIEKGHCIADGSDLIEKMFTENPIDVDDYISNDPCSDHYHLLLQKDSIVYGIIIIYASHDNEDEKARCEYFKVISSTISSVIDKAIMEKNNSNKFEKLSQFQAITVDREVKMIELKKRIAHLEKQLERKI